MVILEKPGDLIQAQGLDGWWRVAGDWIGARKDKPWFSGEDQFSRHPTCVVEVRSLAPSLDLFYLSVVRLIHIQLQLIIN